jgi:hypothetical protein
VAQRKEENRGQVSGGLLRGARVYLLGPMDFAASRETEQKSGWRTRIGQVLREFGVVVFDPWNKPEVGYGKETAGSTGACDAWTFEDSPDGAQKRANLTGHYWETLHIDLRVADNGRLHYRSSANLFSSSVPRSSFRPTARRRIWLPAWHCHRRARAQAPARSPAAPFPGKVEQATATQVGQQTQDVCSAMMTGCFGISKATAR